MRVVAYLCLVCCLLSFNIHANSAPLIIKQGIEKQTFTVAITNEAKPIVEFEIEEDGLLIIEVKQRGHFLYERLWIDGKPQANMDMFGFSEGSDFVSLEVKTGDKIGLEVSPTYPRDEIKSVINSYIFERHSAGFSNVKIAFSSLTSQSIQSYFSYIQSPADFLDSIKKLSSQNRDSTKYFTNLQFPNLLQQLIFNQGIINSDIGKKKTAFTTLNNLAAQKTSDSLELLINYYLALLLPEFIDEEQFFSYLNNSILLAHNLNNQYLYKNARTDLCTAYLQRKSSNTLSCFQAIIDEELLKSSPYELAIMQGNIAHLHFKSGNYAEGIKDGHDSLKTIGKIKITTNNRRDVLLRTAILSQQQSTRLRTLGEKNHALINLMSAINIYNQLNDKTRLKSAILELGFIYLENAQSDIAKYLAKFVFHQFNSDQVNDHYNLYVTSLFLLTKSSIAIGDVKLANTYRNLLIKKIDNRDNSSLHISTTLMFLSLDYRSPITRIKRLKQLITSADLSQEIRVEVYLALGRELIKLNEYQQAYNMLISIEGISTTFNQKASYLTLLSSIQFHLKNYIQADQLIDQALALVQEQYSYLQNLGLRRTFFEQFSELFYLKTKLLIHLFNSTGNDAYLREASRINLPNLFLSSQQRHQLTHQKKREKLAKNLSTAPLSRENVIDVIFTLLQLENTFINAIDDDQLPSQTSIRAKSSVSNITMQYVLFSKESFVFIHSENNIEIEFLPKKSEIDKQVSQLLSALKNRNSDTFKLSMALRKTLIPSSIENSPQEQLTIIPSGLLWNLPFSILPLNTSRSWQDLLLLDKYHINKSINLTSSFHFEPKEVTTILAVADPVFSNNDKRAANSAQPTVSNDLLPRIKQTQREIDALELSFKDTSPLLLTGYDATKNRFISELKETPQIIHIATHGFATFSGFREAGLSFTALTPQGAQIDNHLNIYEIEQLENNAQLVILTACEGNLGQTRFKQPSDSLALAFARGGTKNIIASQWAIPSRSSAQLIEYFYQYLIQSKNYSTALNQAMRTLRKTKPDPLNWAGLTLTQYKEDYDE